MTTFLSALDDSPNNMPDNTAVLAQQAIENEQAANALLAGLPRRDNYEDIAEYIEQYRATLIAQIVDELGQRQGDLRSVTIPRPTETRTAQLLMKAAGRSGHNFHQDVSWNALWAGAGAIAAATLPWWGALGAGLIADVSETQEGLAFNVGMAIEGIAEWATEVTTSLTDLGEFFDAPVYNTVELANDLASNVVPTGALRSAVEGAAAINATEAVQAGWQAVGQASSGGFIMFNLP